MSVQIINPSIFGGGVITQDARMTPYNNGGGSTDPHTLTSMTVASGASLLLVQFGWESSRTVSAVKWGGSGGEDMVNHAAATVSQSGLYNVETWYKISPTAQTASIWVDLSGSTGLVAKAISFFGTDLTTPIVDADVGSGDPVDSLAIASALVPTGIGWVEAFALNERASDTHKWADATEDFDNLQGNTFNCTGAHEEGVTSNKTPSVSTSLTQAMSIAAVMLQAA